MQKLSKYTLISLAMLSLVSAVFAFFFPVHSNFISGHLDNGRLFTREWFTYSYEVVGGYLLLVAAASCVYAATLDSRERAGAREPVFWAGLSILLLGAVYVAGRTLIISWLPGVPAEIQSALGTPYVNFRVAAINNVPQILSAVFIVLFGLAAIVFWAIGSKEDDKHNKTV